MKKLLLLAGVIVAMASCAKDELVDVNLNDPNMIKFTTSYVGATKAGIRTTANVDSVGVYAVANASGNSLAAASSYIIPNTMLKRSGEIWSSSKNYYWPSDVDATATPYDFHAYYPMVGTADAASITSGVITDMPAIKPFAEDQVDILASAKVTPTVKDDVVITLDHMLSKVDFRVDVISRNKNENLVVTITGLELCNVQSVHAGLDLSVPKMLPEVVAAGNETKTTYSYLDGGGLVVTGGTSGAITGAEVGIATSGNLDAVAADSGVDAIDAFLLLPQAYTTAAEDVNYVAGTGALPGETDYKYPYIKLSYTILQNDILIAGTSAAATTSCYALPGFAATTVNSDGHDNAANTWEAGKQYMYVLTFDEASLDPLHDVTLIKFDVVVNDFEYKVTEEITNDPHVTAANLMAEAEAATTSLSGLVANSSNKAEAEGYVDVAAEAASDAMSAAILARSDSDALEADAEAGDTEKAAAATAATEAEIYAFIAEAYAYSATYIYALQSDWGNESSALNTDAAAAYESAVAIYNALSAAPAEDVTTALTALKEALESSDYGSFSELTELSTFN